MHVVVFSSLAGKAGLGNVSFTPGMRKWGPNMKHTSENQKCLCFSQQGRRVVINQRETVFAKREKSPENVGQRGLEQEAQCPFERGNRHRFCVTKSKTTGLQDNRAAAILPEILGQGEPWCRLRKSANQPQL